MRRLIKIAGVIVVAVVVVAAGAVGWRLYDRDPDVSAADVPATPDLIARGAYLVQAADCAACHNIPGGKPFAGGFAFNLPFGTIYSTNITADKATGIGTWSDDDFVRALHRGIAKDGTHLYPAFPYASYTGLSRTDAVAMKAYLFSLPPVHAPARPNQLSFPFNQRWTLAFWNLAFLDDHRFHPDPGLSPGENRGAYLATALGHCGECHTPRNLGFAMEIGRQFGGAVAQGWHAYNITTDKDYGIGDWSDQQIADYLRFGHAAGRGSASGPMGEAVANSLQYLTSDDTRSLVQYLRHVEPQTGVPGTEVDPKPGAMTASSTWAPGATDAQGELGRRLFEGVCASCHAWNGGGRETNYAALAGSQAVNDPEGVNLVRVLLSGGELKTSRGTAYMPSFAGAYNDVELAAVSNYVIGHFGGKTGRVTPELVKQRRDQQ
ncbi:MAG TPA: cytochrome c [Rhodopila sp.]|jgi:mono/diheme cytochrome c family protein